MGDFAAGLRTLVPYEEEPGFFGDTAPKPQPKPGEVLKRADGSVAQKTKLGGCSYNFTRPDRIYIRTNKVK